MTTTTAAPQKPVNDRWLQQQKTKLGCMAAGPDREELEQEIAEAERRNAAWYAFEKAARSLGLVRNQYRCRLEDGGWLEPADGFALKKGKAWVGYTLEQVASKIGWKE